MLELNIIVRRLNPLKELFLIPPIFCLHYSLAKNFILHLQSVLGSVLHAHLKEKGGVIHTYICIYNIYYILYITYYTYIETDMKTLKTFFHF